MSICAAQKCVRVHDKLYGLLGMGSIKLDVDYDLPINRMHACALIEMTTNRPRYLDLKGSASLDDFRPYGAEAARKYAGVTEIAAISETLTRLASLSKAETDDLVLRIVRFPTRRECDELVRSFKSTVRKLDQSSVLSPHEHVSRRVLLASLSKGLEDEEEALQEHLREKIEQEI
ncbi:hypothetical protein LTR82_012162 [Friedmanniomyces endolithicus]|uniref:Uncharacterized protein n=1 Tax=Friedmanniomyces endolithicus TaxID=329885 RepID=A0AAN6FFW0_9PEZI|nr:hypothetical protein LTR82_012162 [Friedmanniomyces endolithicus]